MMNRSCRIALALIASALPGHGGELAKISLPVSCRPLFDGAIKGDAKKITQALTEGADPDCRTEPGRSTALMVAVSNGPLSAVEPLLRKGADPNAQDSAGATALMFAAQLGHADVVRALLKKGADPSLRAKNGQTAIDLARNAGKIKVVAILAKQAKSAKE